MGDMRNKPSVGISPAKSTKIPAKGNNSQVGSTAVWDGPHKPKGPFIKGSSSGSDGIALLAKNAPSYIAGPITKIAGCESC